MRNKKLLTSVVALGMAAVMLLGGTFAWQSISQTAENETANIVNPGGRLHDDFDGSNKDIYVENFGEEPIFARVRLEEYFALVINQGKTYAKTETKLGSETKNANGSYTYTGDIYIFDKDNLKEEGGNTFLAGYDAGTGEYRWNWTVGNEDSTDAYYMPTFNKNKDSLVADVNGWYKNGIGTFGVETAQVAEVITSRDGAQYEGYTAYNASSSVNGNAIYDIDRNSADELVTLSAAALNTLITDGTGTYDTNAVKLVEETHNAKKIGTTNGLISMEDWIALLTGEGVLDEEGQLTETGRDTVGGYWVYDTDGWVYWSSPIKQNTATGRLLDGIKLNGVMNDSWYYAINVVAQFVTADDLGKEDNTGFYDTTAGAVPTTSAEKLLSLITVIDDSTADWSELVTMRNITSDEYDKLFELTGGDNDKMHWQGVGSWTTTAGTEYDDDGGSATSGYYVRGDDEADSKEIVEPGVMVANFRPAFDVKDTVSYDSLTVGDAVVIGTLYVGEDAASVGYDVGSLGYDESNFPKFTLHTALEDETYQMKAIYIGDGVFVCDRCVITNITWNELSAALSTATID